MTEEVEQSTVPTIDPMDFSVLKSTVVELETKVDQQEQIIASMMLGYGEMGVVVETLVSQLVFDDDEQTKKKFLETVQENRKNMMNTLRERAAQTVG